MKTKHLFPVVAVLAWGAGGVCAQEIDARRAYPEFGVGVTGIRATIEPGRVVTVDSVEPGSPAAGALRKGDLIRAAAGRDLDGADPRIALGEAIGQAETSGNLALKIVRNGQVEEVTVQVPVLGAYSRTWPLECVKSAAIVKTNARFIAAAQQADGSYRFDGRPVRDSLEGCLAGLFLLSTGDPKYLPHVERQARNLAGAAAKRPTGSSWHLGYQGILLAEYYLKTGDRSVLAGLKSLCDRAIAMQAAGGWGHGAGVSPGYVQSGLMNSAGVPVLTTLILARECGVDVDEAGFLRALKLFYRMVGHGNVCYGDHRSELWWPNTNGRNAMLACGLSLLEEPRYRRAAEHLAMLVADSYYMPEFGHTGGGFNVLWRGMGSVHVPANKQSHYRRQLDKLAWYYDLCRQRRGGFSMLPSPPNTTRYTGLTWGSGGVGLTYTAPLRTLRITGAPRTRYSVDDASPKLQWGTEADLLFFGTENAAGFGKEDAPPHEVHALLIGKKKDEASVDFCAKHLLHYSPMVRSWAARRLNERQSAAGVAVLAKAIEHDDPRVRRAVYDSISGYDNWGRPMRGRMDRRTASSKFLPEILKVFDRADSAWWEVDGALFALGRMEVGDIRKQMPLIEKYASHDEWYLREAAFWALDGLRESITAAEFERLAGIYADESHVYARNSYDAGFREIAKSAAVAGDDKTLRTFARILGPSLHDAGVVEGYGDEAGRQEAAHRTMMVLGHFNPKIYRYLIGDFEKYLDAWTPYTLHSVWMISGSRWQPGVLKVLEGLGKDGRPICVRLKRIGQTYDKFDTKRIDRRSAGTLRLAINTAVAAWEKKYGEIE